MRLYVSKEFLRKSQDMGLELARLFEPEIEPDDFDAVIEQTCTECAPYKYFAIRESFGNTEEVCVEVSDYVLAQFLPLIAKGVKCYLTLSRAQGDDLRAIDELLGERI